MRWEPLTNNKAGALAAVIAVALVAATSGCSHTINPYADEAALPDEMTSASERAARAANVTPVVRRREWKPATITYPSGQVVHWPTWFEDPFEDKGSEDGKFAWTAEDYVAIGYSFARLLLNTMGWPVSAVVTPPGTPMVSDGRLSRQALGKDHDPTRLGQSERPPLVEAQETEAGQTEADQLAGERTPVDPDEAPVGPPFVEQASHQN